MIVHGFAELGKAMEKKAGQMKFAGAFALTKTAQDIQADVKQSASEKMSIKNSWVLRQIRIKPATKETMQAEVYSNEWFYVDQDEGGTRDPFKEFHAIPARGMKIVTGIDPRKKVIPKRLRYPQVLDKKLKETGTKPFLQKSRNGKMFVGVRPKERKTYDDNGVINTSFYKLWNLQKDPVKIEGREFFQKPATETYRKKIVHWFKEGVKRFVL